MTQEKTVILSVEQLGLRTRQTEMVLLEDISFQLHQGECLAIIGASGAGKSTLLRSLNRLEDVTDGYIRFGGVSFQSIPVNQLRQKIVLVPQEPKLLGMTVLDAIRYPLQLQQLSKSEIGQRLETWINRLKIPEEWLDRNEWQISLGQRQMVCLARALVMQPQILLLDEPTSALDKGKAHLVSNLLIQLAEESGTSIIMVNHQLDVIEHFAKRTIYLKQGKIIKDFFTSEADWEIIHQDFLEIESQNTTNDDF